MAGFDFKKEYKEFYLPPKKPQTIDVPAISFIAVRGTGDPNEEGGDYKAAIGILYSLAYTIKMSKLGSHKMAGYYDYVVPPLEGLWWQKGNTGIDFQHKEQFEWISMIRLPEFVTKEEFNWALTEAGRKKQLDVTKAEFFTYHEGLCVQCMHIGPYEKEAETILRMEHFAQEEGYTLDLSQNRFHHEIYLTDVRKCKPENWKTVIRLPLKR